MFCYVNQLHRNVFMDWMEMRGRIHDGDEWNHFEYLFKKCENGEYKDQRHYK